jgi:hypothetical protein
MDNMLLMTVVILCSETCSWVDKKWLEIPVHQYSWCFCAMSILGGLGFESKWLEGSFKCGKDWATGSLKKRQHSKFLGHLHFSVLLLSPRVEPTSVLQTLSILTEEVRNLWYGGYRLIDVTSYNSAQNEGPCSTLCL